MRQKRRIREEVPVRLFKNPVMESLTLLSFGVFAVVWSIILFAALTIAWHMSSSITTLLWHCLLGFAVWFPFEYLMHRFLFHFNGRSAFAKSMVYLLHGNHHEQPNHPLRNLMPLSASLPLALLIWVGCVAGMGYETGSAIAAGFLCGYVAYDIVHYSCHQFPMRMRLLRRIKIHHIDHHYRQSDANYAITAVFLDKVCNTKCDRS
ncbi:fatty acid hydroxylase superfamily protein [Komagataeibacter europaeus]|uniref:Fatty acid hydroxylase superfamily protein n=1 Tax=Komagataeibacter europaeus TaxID=33995 RepID=A0A0M0EG39_KOMEU|nr:sterol desaturase family protein [Komagataeibacter europaeus]KON64237.1 fatty acid hydroxylase superfamily protein [Komagataeibacter europaeus]